MPRILVNPDQLQGLATEWHATGELLHSLGSQVSRIEGDLEWEVRRQAGIAEQIGQAITLARSLSQQAETLAGYLAQKAQTFRTADAQGAQDVGQITEQFSSWQQQWLQSPAAIIGSYPVDAVARQLGLVGGSGGGNWLPVAIPSALTHTLLAAGADQIDDYNKLKDWLALPAALALGYKMLDNEVIIHGSSELKELAGLSGHLTHILPENLPGHMAEETLHVNAGGLALSLAPTWLHDIDQYGSQGLPKLGAALTVDTVLHAGMSVATDYAGTWLGATAVVGGAALLGVSAPAVAVVAGGIVGGIAVGYVGDAVLNWFDKTPAHTALVNATAGAYSAAGSWTAHTAENALTGSAHVVDGALDAAISAVQHAHLPHF